MGQKGGVLRVILLIGQARGAQRFMYQMLYLQWFLKAGEVLSTVVPCPEQGAVSGQRCWLPQCNHGSVDFHSGWFYILQLCFTDVSQLPLLKSCLVAVGKCQSIVCNDGDDHSQSAHRTEFQVFCDAVGWCQSEATECVCLSFGIICVSYWLTHKI